MNRRDCLVKMNSLGLLAVIPGILSKGDDLLTRTIPSTGERLPVVGLGTWKTFDVGNSENVLTALKQVLQNLKEEKCLIVHRCTVDLNPLPASFPQRQK